MKTFAFTFLSVLLIGVVMTACVEKRPAATVVTPTFTETKTEVLESTVDTTTVGK